jgi:hypothetical protein
MNAEVKESGECARGNGTGQTKNACYSILQKNSANEDKK